MRNAVVQVYNFAGTGSNNGIAIPANQIISASFQGVFNDATLAGTLKIQASNDLAPAGQLMSFTPTNWVDIPSMTATVTAGAGVLITIPQTAYQWMRVVFTRTAGASTPALVNMNSLSV